MAIADTYEGMAQRAGDETTLTSGFQTVLDIVSPLLKPLASGAEMTDRS